MNKALRLGVSALLLGYRARLVAATLAVFSIVTALTFHNNLADQMQFLNFFKNFATSLINSLPRWDDRTASSFPSSAFPSWRK